MLLSVLLSALLILSGTQATHFFGTVMTYYPKQTHADGSITVSIRYKLSFRSCTDIDAWFCGGSCGSLVYTLNIVDMEGNGDWCQREGIMTPVITPSFPSLFLLAGGNWISNIQNGVVSWQALTDVELKTRSDTRRANNSPQSTILPAVRVPSNCERDFNFLAFDPDGDNVKCRFGNDSLSECNPCSPPSILNLSSSCTLSFNQTNSTNEGPYAVQLVMEDFPWQQITLTGVSGFQETRTTTQAISKIPLQFVLYVDSAVPSCTEGLFLPKFLPPTPENKAKLIAVVNQILEISISAEAKNATITELLFSGPSGVVKTSLGSGNFTLRWTPSVNEDGESHPICFVVQATLNFAYYQSELRCVLVQVQYNFRARVNMKIMTSLSPGGNVNDAVLQEIKDQLVSLGLPSNTTLLVLKENSVIVNTTATPVV